jgi:hypothetical protein
LAKLGLICKFRLKPFHRIGPSTLMGLPQLSQTANNWIGGGCILADHAMLAPFNHNCSAFVDPDRRLHNSDQGDLSAVF